MRGLIALALIVGCRIPNEQFPITDGGGGGGDGDMGDASIDAMPDAPGCWSLTPSNFDPCAIGAPDAGYTLPGDATLNTGTGMITIGTSNVAFGRPYTYGSSTYLLVYDASFTVPLGTTLTVVGARPLLIVADTTIDIEGTIDFSVASGTADPECVATASPMKTLAPGGSGGGYGFDGGSGGAGAIAAAPAELANGNANVSPLREGCPGVRGGASTTKTGGAGGKAGGAVELSARVQVKIVSGVFADGGGGASGTAASTTDASGGGGGGAGGSVLIEAPDIQLANAKVCAVGGGGGPGGDANSITSGGTQGLDCMVGAGGPATSGHGGNGSATGVGAVGGAGSSSGGGGGGGSAGRIVLHGTVTSTGSVTTRPSPLNLPP